MFLALSHALRKKIIKNCGAWMSIKDSQSLSQETGIHEAFLTRVGTTTKGQSSLSPPQPEKESSRGTRELCWCKGRINQDLEYSLETSSPIWMLQQLCSPWVWPQRVHRKSPTWGKKRKERRRRMHEALESRQRLDFFFSTADLRYFGQVTYFVTQLSCENNLSFPDV